MPTCCCASICSPRRCRTLSGLKTAYVLFALHLSTRRIVLAEATLCSDSRWMGQMARNLLMACEDLEVSLRYVVHDRDALLTRDFDRTLAGAGLQVVKTPFRAPDANAHAERWVRSVKEECLDHLVLLGLGSLHRALSAYCGFHNGHRPHQGIANHIPDPHAGGGTEQRARPAEDGRLVECQQFLGGLLKPYSRRAA